MPIRCKLISPTNLMLEHPMLSPVKESEFVVMGVEEYQEQIKNAKLMGALIGAAIMGLIVDAIMLIMAGPLHAQSIPAVKISHPATLMLDAEGGSASGLGFRLPSLVFGITAEKAWKARLEAQGSAKWSPDNKYITHDGNQVQVGALGLLWLTRGTRQNSTWSPTRLGITGAVRYSRLWTSAFDKSGWWPSVGIVLRDNWQGAPGRLYLSYTFATGCQWATAANPCAIQSNRESGVEGYQEFRFFSHWRWGYRMSWVHFADQSNPRQPSAGRTWHDTGTSALTVRYLFRAEPGDDPY